MIRPDTKRKTPTKLCQPILKFVDEGNQPAESDGLLIKDIDSLHKFIKFLFAYSQEKKKTASREDRATPEITRSWKHKQEMAHRIHNQAEVDIGLQIGLNILLAFQRHLRQRKPVLDGREYVRLDSHWFCVVYTTKKTLLTTTVSRFTKQQERLQSHFNVLTSNWVKEEQAVVPKRIM